MVVGFNVDSIQREGQMTDEMVVTGSVGAPLWPEPCNHRYLGTITCGM